MITARYHREVPQRYRLEAAKCSSCGLISFPPRLVCPGCKGRIFEKINLNSEGKILSFTIIRVGSDKFSKETPFAVGVIELNDGVRITAQIADADPGQISIGQKVRIVFRRIQDDGRAGIHCYGYKAVLSENL